MPRAIESDSEPSPGVISRVLRSRAFHSFVGITVSIFLLLWVFSEVEFSKLKTQLLAANYWALIPAIGIIILHFAVRSMRWYYLLPNGHLTTFRNRFDGIIVGNFANFVLPLRAGEFIRPFMLSKVTQKKVSFAEAFASIVTERFFDLAATITTFAILLPYFPSMPDWVATSAWILGGVAFAIMAFIFTVSLFPSFSLSLFDRIFTNQKSKYIQKLRHFLEDFTTSAKILAKPDRLIKVLGLTVFVWITNYALFYCLLFLLDIPQTFLLGTAVGVIIALAVAAPSAPGFIGVYQTACLAAFSLYQVSEESALVFSIISHVLQYVAFISYGVYALSAAGLKLSELQKRSEESGILDED